MAEWCRERYGDFPRASVVMAYTDGWRWGGSDAPFEVLAGTTRRDRQTLGRRDGPEADGPGASAREGSLPAEHQRSRSASERVCSLGELMRCRTLAREIWATVGALASRHGQTPR